MARLLVSAVLVIAAATAVAATQSAFFGGAFAVGDPYCVFCPDPNLLSNAGLGCHCPTGFTAYPEPPASNGPWKLKAPSTPLMRVASTCSVGNKEWHSSVSFCIASPGYYAHNSSRFEAPAAGAQDQFAGVYQTVAGQCRIHNPLTGDCSCPSDSEPIVVKHKAAGAAEPVVFSATVQVPAHEDATLVFCGRRSSAAPFNFAGVFTTETETGKCINENPFSGSCSCQTGSQATTLSLVGAKGKGMTVHVCGPKLQKVPNVQICSGVDADPTGATDAGPAITRCFTQRSEVRLPDGVYLIATGIKGEGGGRIESYYQKGNTCLMDSVTCPVLRASPTLAGPMFYGRADMYNVVFDGNRLARTALLSQCAATPSVGYNIFQRSGAGAGGFQMQGCAVVNALCGAGLYSQIVGGLFSGAQIQSTLFRGNGGHDEATKSWANGLHIGSYSNGFQAQQNYYTDNSDSHVAIDEPTSGIEIEESTYTMQSSFAFAGIRSSFPVNDTFLGPIPTSLPDPVPNWGNQYQQNSIHSNGLSYFGIIIGGRPWKANSPLVNMQQGLEVEENDVSGSAVLINWDAGVGVLSQNNYGSYLGKFAHCAGANSLLNISPESRVDRSSESHPQATHNTYVGCVP